MSQAIDSSKEAKLTALLERAEQRKGVPQVNNWELYAGSDMYYYCRICKTEMRYPEAHLEPVPNYCTDCEVLMDSLSSEASVEEALTGP